MRGAETLLTQSVVRNSECAENRARLEMEFCFYGF